MHFPVPGEWCTMTNHTEMVKNCFMKVFELSKYFLLILLIQIVFSRFSVVHASKSTHLCIELLSWFCLAVTRQTELSLVDCLNTNMASTDWPSAAADNQWTLGCFGETQQGVILTLVVPDCVIEPAMSWKTKVGCMLVASIGIRDDIFFF